MALQLTVSDVSVVLFDGGQTGQRSGVSASIL